MPARQQGADSSVPLYLDESVMGTPAVVLACAARETLHMGDLVESMLSRAIIALMTNDRKLAAQISQADNAVDRLYDAVKLYVTKVTRESLEEEDGRRAMEIISFAINLEHIGDIIDKNLMELVAEKIKHRYTFSRDGSKERDLKRVHSHICSVAYPVLETAGELPPSRLKEGEAAALASRQLAAGPRSRAHALPDSL